VPFLRVIRDKRGYETTYLMHWFRDGSRQRSRILYVFRTPGGVRVGRDPLEPEVLRDLERRHPEIAFEWRTIRENQQVIEPAVEQRRRRPKADDRAAGEQQAAKPSPPLPSPGSAAPPEPDRPKSIPSKIDGATADDQIAFLNEWYPAIRERIQQRIADPVRQQTLFALAERLNASTWTDADQITAGLQQAAEALERFSHVFARRRRRGRRRSGQPAAPDDGAPPPPGSEAP
jgi:hypothetical protein